VASVEKNAQGGLGKRRSRRLSDVERREEDSPLETMFFLYDLGSRSMAAREAIMCKARTSWWKEKRDERGKKYEED
jgi:hypothetical protein